MWKLASGCVLLITFNLSCAAADMFTGTGMWNAEGKDPAFKRGMQSTMYCGNNPESWVRGSAWLSPEMGYVPINVMLETDSATAGPKGKVTVHVKDATGHDLAILTTNEISIPGKGSGHADIRIFSGNATISAAVAAKAASVYVVAQCTGSQNGNSAVGSIGDTIKQISTTLTTLGKSIASVAAAGSTG